MTKAKPKKSDEPLTAYAEDQLRRLREYMKRFPSSGGMPVSSCGPPLPPIWLGLEASGHVVVEWSAERVDARVRPA